MLKGPATENQPLPKSGSNTLVESLQLSENLKNQRNQPVVDNKPSYVTVIVKVRQPERMPFYFVGENCEKNFSHKAFDFVLYACADIYQTWKARKTINKGRVFTIKGEIMH